MTKALILGLLAVLIGAIGCNEKKRKGGLPAATEWRAGQNDDQSSKKLPTVPDMPGNNPHAGLGIAPPGGGGADPHAGLDMNGANPMSGGGGGPRVPARTGHPDRTLSGVLTMSPEIQAKLPAGAWLFIYAKPWDAKTNKMVDRTIVVKVDKNPKFPYKFTIDESSAMSGLPLTGTVVFEARVDGDSNASSRKKGDVVGRIKVKVPNLKLTVAMDTVLTSDVEVGGM